MHNKILFPVSRKKNVICLRCCQNDVERNSSGFLNHQESSWFPQAQTIWRKCLSQQDKYILWVTKSEVISILKYDSSQLEVLSLSRNETVYSPAVTRKKFRDCWLLHLSSGLCPVVKCLKITISLFHAASKRLAIKQLCWGTSEYTIINQKALGTWLPWPHRGFRIYWMKWYLRVMLQIKTYNAKTWKYHPILATSNNEETETRTNFYLPSMIKSWHINTHPLKKKKEPSRPLFSSFFSFFL